MRVALVLPDLRGGGAERVALSLVHDLVANGHEVDCVLTSAGGELIALLPPEVRLFELKASRFRKALFPLVRYFRTRKPDATHAFMWPVTVLAVIARRIAGVTGRLILSDHNTLSKQYGHRKAAHAALRFTTSLLYGAADSRICVSEGVADDLAQLSGLPRDSFSVIYNPTVPPETMPERTSASSDLWPECGARILTVGSLKAQKNHRLLIHAFANVARHRPATLMLLGEGPLRTELEALARERGVADRVTMPGFILDPWPLYASADVFVLSSDYEGYALVLVEAMFCGLTVVSTDCPSGPSEILAQGQFGRLVPVDDVDALSRALMDALDHPSAPEELLSRAKEMASGALEAHRKALLGE